MTNENTPPSGTSRVSGFGTTVKPVYRRPSRWRKIGTYLVIFLCALSAPLSLWGWDDLYRNFIERDPPLIEFHKPPVGVGLEPLALSVTLEDALSGLDAVVVRVEQGGKSVVLLQKQYTEKQKRDELKITLDGKERGLKKGEAKISIAAFDHSFWSNGSRSSISLIVDYDKPEISVVPDQHNAVIGGAELVFFRVAEENLGFHGVTVGAELFPGFPAKNFDSEFEVATDLYLALFPLPATRESQDGNEGGVRVFARDGVGNISYAPVSYRAQTQSGKDLVETLSADQIDSVVEPLFEQYSKKLSKLAGDPTREILPSSSDIERAERLQAVNEKYRALIEEALKPLFDRPKDQKFWHNAFAKPVGKQGPGFGDQVIFQFGDQSTTRYRSTSTVFLSPSGTEVRSANTGIVIFADDLGVYGKTVIVDHGFGLTSLYGHLSSFDKLEGDRLERGDVIGRVGSTGLTFRPGLAFEFRLHGEPVRPIEWFDSGWQRDHIESKVKNLKRQLGIRTVGVLE